MKSQRLLCVSVVVLLLVCLIAPATSLAQAKPNTGTKAGSITALLPVATIDRGLGKNKTTVEAKKGDEIIWNDLVKTQKGGRARITLNDQSILSLGSQAELRVLKHDARTQQTALQLSYGRVRAEVASVTRDGGRFELRTPTAVAGVIGTDFGTDSSIPGVTTFLCIAGVVTVGNVDEKVPGVEPCPAGTTVTVAKGVSPTKAKPATQQQIQQLIADTEPAVISSLSPGSGLPGTTVSATASGSKMAGIKTVAVNEPGVKVSIDKAATENSVGLKIEIDAHASAGPRTITFTKSNGQSAAAIFTVIKLDARESGGDTAGLRKAYREIIEQERLSEIAGLNAIGLGVQQSAGDTLAEILAENSKLSNPLDPNKIEQNLAQDVGPLLQALQSAADKLNAAAANASKGFADPPPAPAAPPVDDPKALKEAFDKANKTLIEEFKSIHDGLGNTAKGVNEKLLASLNSWLESIKTETANQKSLPTPKSDADERSLDQGLNAQFDGSRSKGAGNSSISSFSWVLCDASYKPQQVGVLLPATDNKCRVLPGYASSTPDFKFQTCNLAPQDYIARLTVVDDKQNSAAMDFRLHVLKGDYEDPATRLQSAAAAFQTLQSDRFMAFFDSSFSNYGSLSETIRRTFETLASMTINLRISQASISCNEATVRADWQQNYTFKADQTCDNLPAGTSCQRVVFTQTEQLTSRMIRVADASGSRILGWNIVDFQGDNGTVQGTAPGPRTVDTALPDLVIVGLAPTSGPRAQREGATTSPSVGVAPGVNTFEALVGNIGTGPLSAPAKIRFVALGPDNVEVASDLEDIPVPLGVGQQVAILGHLTIPDLGPGISVRITATVNPGCVVAEKNCDGANIDILDVLIGIIDLKLSNLQPVGTYLGTQPGAITVDVTNIGTRASVASVNNLKLGPAVNNLVTAGVSIPALAPGATVTITVPFTVPPVGGTQNIVAALSPASPFDFNATNDFTSGSINVTAPVVDLQMLNLAFSAGTPLAPPFLSGETHTVKFDIKNIGNIAPAPGDVYSCKLTGTAGTKTFTPLALPSVAAGATVTGLTFTFVVPINFAGTDTLACSTSQDPFEATATFADNQASLATQVNSNIDLQLINVPVPNGADQMGAAGNVTFGVQNFGLDTAAAGYDIVLKINGSVVTPTNGPTIGPALIGGGSTPITINFTIPQIGSAPQDLNVPASLQVNANAAVAETNSSNNLVSRTLRLVDFTLTTIPTGPLSAVAGRSFNSTVVQVLPTTYPLPLNVSYTGAPAGLTNAGFQSPTIMGTQLGSNGITGSAGTYTVTPGAIVQGVAKSSGPITVQVLPEIAMSLATAFSFSSPNTPTPFSVQVSGGINPVNLNLSLPTGVTIASGPGTSTSVSTPGSVTWQLQADNTAAIGNGLTNIVLTATDAGIGSNNVGAGNIVFAPPYSNGGFDNYTISRDSPFYTTANSAVQHTTGTGTDALQVGEDITFNFVVSNNGNLGQTGNVTIQMSCVPSCGTPNATVAAPGPGQSVFVGIDLVSLGLTPGSYSNVTAAITAAPPQSTTADDTVALPSFDVFDFTPTISGTPPAIQNVPLNLPGTLALLVTQNPTGAGAATLPLVVTTLGNTTTNAPGSVTGSLNINMSRSAGVPSGTQDTITASITRFGVTKSVVQVIQYYSASLDNVSTGQPGDSSGTHIVMPIGGSGTTVHYKLTGDFSGGAATFNNPSPVNGISGAFSPISQLPSVAGNPVDVTFTGGTSATGTEDILILSFPVPDTIPVQTVSKQVFFFVVQPPDLAVQSITPAGISSSRSFGTSDPWVSGEGIEFNVTIANNNSTPSSPNLHVKSYLGSVLLNDTVIPSIASPSTPYTFLMHVRAPNPAPTAGGNSIFVQVDSDPNEVATGNNFLSLSVATSDWILVTTTGTAASPLSVASGGNPGVTVQAIATLAGGIVLTPVNVVLAGTTTNITATPPAGNLIQPTAGVPPQGTVAISVSGTAPAGQYGVPLIGQIHDGGVTSQQGATIHLAVNGGIENPVVITSSVSNALAGLPGTCTGACTVRQIDGYLIDTLDLTATGGLGTVDLIFTDDAAIVSNVSNAGVAQPQYLNAVQYGAATALNFAPLDTNGQVTAGPANVVVSPTAATTAARGYPIQETVGSQQTTLYFNIGDLSLSTGLPCVQIPPNTTTGVDLTFTAVSGFNEDFVYSWNFNGTPNIGLAQSSSGSVSPSGGIYPNLHFDITNLNAAAITTSVSFDFDVTIHNAISSATKHFSIPVHLNSGPCGSARREGSTFGGGSIAGSWSRGPSSGSGASAARRTATVAATNLPDLQIKSTDVSISPSVPKAGDTIDFRFKVSNAGTASAQKVPIALQVNGSTVASQTFDIAAGSSTLGAFQWASPKAGAVPNVQQLPASSRQLNRSRFRGADTDDRQDRNADLAASRPGRQSTSFDAKLVIDPANTVHQASTTNKSVQVSKMMLSGGPVSPATAVQAHMDRVFLEVGTLCVGFRVATGSAGECETGADVDISIVDFATSRFELIAQFGIADLGAIDPGTANITGAQFGSRASLIVGHTYAVQLAGGNVGILTISRQLTPMQLAAEARKHFGGNAIRIVGRLGAGSGPIEAGDVSGTHRSEPFTYFDLAFTTQQ